MLIVFDGNQFNIIIFGQFFLGFTGSKAASYGKYFLFLTDFLFILHGCAFQKVLDTVPEYVWLFQYLLARFYLVPGPDKK